MKTCEQRTAKDGTACLFFRNCEDNLKVKKYNPLANGVCVSAETAAKLKIKGTDETCQTNLVSSVLGIRKDCPAFLELVRTYISQDWPENIEKLWVPCKHQCETLACKGKCSEDCQTACLNTFKSLKGKKAADVTCEGDDGEKAGCECAKKFKPASLEGSSLETAILGKSKKLTVAMLADKSGYTKSTFKKENVKEFIQICPELEKGLRFKEFGQNVCGTGPTTETNTGLLQLNKKR